MWHMCTHKMLKDANEWGSLRMLSCFSNDVSLQGGTALSNEEKFHCLKKKHCLKAISGYVVTSCVCSVERREEKRKSPGTVRRI